MKYIILLGILVLGCELQNPDEGFYIDSKFNKEERNEFEIAVKEECIRTEGKFCPILLDTEWINNIKKVSYLKPKALDVAYGRTYIHRSLNSANIQILIVKDIDINIFKTIIRHELAHAGGCRDHLTESGNVMYFDLKDQPQDWTKKDIECIDDDYGD